MIFKGIVVNDEVLHCRRCKTEEGDITSNNDLCCACAIYMRSMMSYAEFLKRQIVYSLMIDQLKALRDMATSVIGVDIDHDLWNKYCIDPLVLNNETWNGGNQMVFLKKHYELQACRLVKMYFKDVFNEDINFYE